MNYSKKIKKKDTVFSQEIDGEVVLLDMASENYFGMDAVGSDIWRLLQEGKTLQETYDVLRKDYDVTSEQLKHDLEAFVGRLLGSGLVAVID